MVMRQSRKQDLQDYTIRYLHDLQDLHNFYKFCRKIASIVKFLPFTV